MLPFLETVISLIYPRRCPVCDAIVPLKGSDPFIHAQCRSKIRYIRGNTCMKCGKPLSGDDNDAEYCTDCRRVKHVFDRGFALFDYRSISGSLYRFKYL